MKRFLICFAALACIAQAATTDEFKRDCNAFKEKPGIDTVKGCLSDLFTLKPLHPIVKSIVPGGGTGVGANLTFDRPRGQWQRVWTTQGAISMRTFVWAESKLTLTHPKFGEWNTARDAFATHFYVRAYDLPLMPFYGIGPNTSRASLVDFGERDIRAGGDLFNPLSSWFGVGGAFEGIFPQITRMTDPKIQSIETRFSEATAPGLASQPNFTRAEIFVRPHHADPFEVDSRIGYSFYHDTGTGHYSFRRLRADVRYNIYPERSNGQPHRDSVLTIHGLLSLSDTSAGNAVPFYLQETLGGSDINGEPTLRGFADYRFRGPDLVLIQTQYERRIWKIFGIIAFYDVGQVATRKSDLDWGHMRHSYGFGGNIWLGAKVVFRAYVGLGSGEGAHPYFGVAPGLF